MKLPTFLLLLALAVRATQLTFHSIETGESARLLDINNDTWSERNTETKTSPRLKTGISVCCAILAATAVPVFVSLTWFGVLKLYPAIALASTITVLCALATANQFVYPAYLFGQQLHSFFTTDKPKFGRLFVGFLELLISTFANIPLLYLNHTAFASFAGNFIYVWDAMCLIGGNIVWIWAIDSYVQKIQVFLLKRSNPELENCLSAVAHAREHIRCLNSLKNERDILDIYDNLPALNFSNIADNAFLKSLKMEQPGKSPLVSKYFGGALGGILGAAGSIVYYNLGINASLTCLHWLNISDSNILIGFSHASGIFGLLTAGAFNSIAGANVMSKWFQNITNVKDTFKASSFLPILAGIVQFFIVSALAIGASVPQMELTLRHFSQNTPLSTAVDILALVSGFLAAYWPSKELLSKALNKLNKKLRRDSRLTEKKEAILQHLHDIEESAIANF